MPADVKSCFESHGYAILGRFFSNEEIDRVTAAIEQTKRERPFHVVTDVIDPNDNKAFTRTTLGLLTDDQIRSSRMKINDLYLELEAVRTVALDARLAGTLAQLMGETPGLCNSLSLDYGSEQPHHV